MKMLVKIAVFAVMVMFGSSAFAQDPRCTTGNIVWNAIIGAGLGALYGDNHRAAGRGGAILGGAQAVTCATQSVTIRRTVVRGGGQGGYQQPQQQYYDDGYRRRDYYRPQPGEYIGPTDYNRPDPEPYYDANGYHCNRISGTCKHASGTGYVFTMQ